ncbi:MAG: glycosyltransferase family protein [Planctomycetota bacterium]|jgi:glycosyltransferase involved in cell wall biosynthesis
MPNETTVAHITHEAVGKIGGIGAVLHGLFTCNSYLEAVDRSILVSPLFTIEGPASNRLGEDGEVIYSSVDGLGKTGYAPAFRKIENLFNVGIVYGRRTFIDKQTGIKSSPEVLLIDVRHIDKAPVDKFKKQLFEQFGIRSDLYEHLWEYEQYVRLAPAAIATLKAIGAAIPSTIIISHEFMGMPTSLAAILEPTCDFKTIFYAHEVATMRCITENHPGHDTMFYNVIKQAHNSKLYVNDVFGSQRTFFKHALVEASKYCDNIFAVGDYVAEELRFLAPEFETANIDIVYNGIPAYQITLADKLQSREKLQLYCENLLTFKPDFVFTHVARMVQSKGIWRDLRVLEQIEKELRALGKTGVFILLSTETSPRRRRDIYNMESAYNWPVAHREGWPDLSEGEANLYTAIQQFNAKSRNIKAIFINQFGFSREKCGKKMPKDMEFMDIRKGSDVEFGQSTYEPFGIAQLESLTFGGICVISSVCGCAGFVRDVASGENGKNVIIADYTNLNHHSYDDIEDLLQIDQAVRDRIEIRQSQKVAKKIVSQLKNSQSDTESMIQTGYELAQNMSWEMVVKNYLFNSLQKALQKQHAQSVYTKK